MSKSIITKWVLRRAKASNVSVAGEIQGFPSVCLKQVFRSPLRTALIDDLF